MYLTRILPTKESPDFHNAKAVEAVVWKMFPFMNNENHRQKLGILHRRERIARPYRGTWMERQSVLVQSSFHPDIKKLPTDWVAGEPKNISEHIEKISHRELLKYRFTASVTIKQKKKILPIKDVEGVENWLLKRQEDMGADIDRSQLEISFRPNIIGRGFYLFNVQYDGFLRVSDTKRFSHTLKSGVGRGKNYGLGLMTVLRT